MAHLIRSIGTKVEAWLAQQGQARATVLLSVLTVMAACGVHVLIKTALGQHVNQRALVNITVEGFAVSLPLIFYSRRAITRLAASRAALEVMSRKLKQVAEAAQQSSQAKSAFLANMSHELRTPLNAILGFSEIMKEQHLGPLANTRYLSYAADIHSSGRHLLGIINDILDLAKIESGKMSLDDAEEFALVPALAASLTMLTGLGEKHGVTVSGRWDGEEVRLIAVERMVRQIAINLIGNAVKFTPAGGRVVLAGAPTPEGGYRLTVSDTGIGMTEAEVANALVPFGQNRAKMAVHHEGTGLGLPLAKAMMELHGGALTIQSLPCHGTTVTLTFPASCVARDRVAA